MKKQTIFCEMSFKDFIEGSKKWEDHNKKLIKIKIKTNDEVHVLKDINSLDLVLYEILKNENKLKNLEPIIFKLTKTIDITLYNKGQKTQTFKYQIEFKKEDVQEVHNKLIQGIEKEIEAKNKEIEELKSYV